MRDCDGTNDDEVRDILSILIGDLMGCQLNEVVAIAARSWSVSSHPLSLSVSVARTHTRVGSGAASIHIQSKRWRTWDSGARKSPVAP